MYPDEFDVAARAILHQDLGMQKHEVDENAKVVNIHLLHIFTQGQRKHFACGLVVWLARPSHVKGLASQTSGPASF